MIVSNDIDKLVNLLSNETRNRNLNWKQDIDKTVSVTLLSGSVKITQSQADYILQVFNKRGEVAHRNVIAPQDIAYNLIDELYISALDNALDITETIEGLLKELEDKDISLRIVDVEQMQTGTKIKFSNRETHFYTGIPVNTVLELLNSDDRMYAFKQLIKGKYKFIRTLK